jgi:hypothetical protein
MSYRIDRPDFYPNKTLKRALDNIKPPPCERVSICPHFNECASELKACHAFVLYVNNSSQGFRGRSVERGSPNRHWYNEVFYNHRQE